jgi:putative ABC transport system ATP-binding protein
MTPDPTPPETTPNPTGRPDAAGREVLIEIRDINKEFNLGKLTVYALKDISLDIYKGEYLSIMGPSGSGKSTLFNMIGALDKPTSGVVRLGDIQLNKLTSRKLAYIRGNHIGYVFQSYNLIFAYTAIDNVAMPCLFSGLSYEESVGRAKASLERVGLGHRMEHRPDELSGGQQQRVAIARALANDPKIILADEPTANLDLKTGEQIIELLKELCDEKGVTIVSATHDHKMLASSDRILWIRDGAVDKIQTAAEAGIKVGSIE